MKSIAVFIIRQQQRILVMNTYNMADYLKAGVCGFGIGSNIVNKNLIASGDYHTISELAKKYTKVIAQ